jgi:hypothetical protein
LEVFTAVRDYAVSDFPRKIETGRFSIPLGNRIHYSKPIHLVRELRHQSLKRRVIVDDPRKKILALMTKRGMTDIMSQADGFG